MGASGVLGCGSQNLGAQSGKHQVLSWHACGIKLVQILENSGEWMAILRGRFRVPDADTEQEPSRMAFTHTVIGVGDSAGSVMPHVDDPGGYGD